ncbi:meiosis-specific protein MEI4 [Pelobates fuscus]|uniref:meiosis-specific protein MEI4 n=1 Tax=Pelobates fuscus TaxID=191477 RepID=UPI002FE45EC0
MDTQSWYQMTAKLALAIAIIRSKPEEKSSREYTVHLSNLVSYENVNWRAKVGELEAEVHHLRQQILLSKINSRLISEKENSGLISEICEHSGEQLSQLENDSGCVISNEEMINALTDDSLNSNSCDVPCTSQSYFIPPTNNLSITHFSPISEKQMSHQIQFLNHLLGLGKLTAGRFLGEFAKHENECRVITDSVSGLLNGLISLYGNPKPFVSTYQIKAIETIRRLFTDSYTSKYILQNCMKKLEDFEKKLIKSILLDDRINRFQMQQAMRNCLVLLGKCEILKGPLINLLCSEIKHFVDEMLIHQQNCTRYDIVQYENIFSLFLVLENLLQCTKDRPESLLSELFEEETKLFIQSLDNTILCMSDEFPLFCLYLWRLGTLFPCIQLNMN